MDVIWYKVWHDLWHNKGRTLLAILSIASGVFAIGAIFGLVDQLLNGMDEAHFAVNPAHVSAFTLTLVERERFDSIAELDGVVDAELQNRIGIRFKTTPDGEWQAGTITMRDDYEAQKFDFVTLIDGEWPQELNIGVERLTSQAFGLDVGDEIIIELDGTDRSFPIAGKIRHPFVEPPQFGGEAHFFSDAAGMARLGIAEGTFSSVMMQVEPYSREYAEAVAGEIRDRLGRQGVTVAVTIYQDPARHWGRDFVDGMMVVLRVMAIVSLFLSVVLVANTMTALITQQTDQIGVIKAIGGVSGTISRIYLAGVVVYGLVALFIALPLGTLAAFYGSSWFLNIFNIEYTVFQIAPQAIFWQVLAATAVPVLAGLWPILQGANITVREAIATYGLGHDFGSSHLDRFVEKISAQYLPAVYAASLGNMFRRKGRLLLTQLVLIVAGVMFLVVMTLVASTNNTLDNESARTGYDVRIGFLRPQRAELVYEMARTIPGVQNVEMWSAYSATILREGERLRDSAGLGAQLTGVPPETTMRTPLITNGRWLEPGDRQVVVISEDSAEENRIAVGDEIRLDLGPLGEEAWQVVGLYKYVAGASFETEPIYAPADVVVDVTKQANRGSLLHVTVADRSLQGATAVAEALKTVFEERNMTIALFTTKIKEQERIDIDNQFASVVSMLLGLAALMAVVGGIGLMGALGISVVERTREIGVLRAIGAPSRTILRLFIMEGVLQGLLSWFVAIPLALVFSRPLANALGAAILGMDLDYTFSFTAVFIWLVLVVLISAVSAIVPARSATRISVRQSLAYA